VKSSSTDPSSELSKASQWTRNYRDKNPGAPKGHCIKKHQLDAILNQPGCEGIRVYYGLDEEGNRKLILVGIDVDENDIITETGITSFLRAAETDGGISEPSSAAIATELPPCPPCCSIENPLNS
jgi:hypothetical protein